MDTSLFYLLLRLYVALTFASLLGLDSREELAERIRWLQTTKGGELLELDAKERTQDAYPTLGRYPTTTKSS